MQSVPLGADRRITKPEVSMAGLVRSGELGARLVAAARAAAAIHMTQHIVQDVRGDAPAVRPGETA